MPGPYGVPEHHRDVEIAALQAGDRLVRLAFAEAQLDLRVAPPVQGDRLGDERGARARKARQPHAAALQPRDRSQLALGVGEPRQDHVRVRDQRPARVGEPHAARTALQEGGAGLLLERRDLLADGRLREVERVRGGRERASFRHFLQDPQAAHVEH